MNAVAALVKLYVRSLPEPILTNQLRVDFFAVASLDNRESRLESLRKLLRLLPASHYDTLRYLMAHLSRVCALEDVNKMNVRNLGIVFSGTMMMAARVFSDFIIDFELLFPEAEAQGEEAEAQGEEVAETPTHEYSARCNDAQKTDEAQTPSKEDAAPLESESEGEKSTQQIDNEEAKEEETKEEGGLEQ